MVLLAREPALSVPFGEHLPEVVHEPAARLRKTTFRQRVKTLRSRFDGAERSKRPERRRDLRLRIDQKRGQILIRDRLAKPLSPHPEQELEHLVPARDLGYRRAV